MRLALAAAAVLCPLACADVLIYATNGLNRPLEDPDTLIAFHSDDPRNWWVVGSMNVPDIGFGGLDFDADGNLFAYASFFKRTGGAASGLYRVDLNTGAATLVGSRPSTQSLQDIAFNPVDGQLYGINSQGNVSRLYRINMTTGVTTLVGAFTGMPAQQHVMSFAIDSQGNHYVHEMNEDKIYQGAGLDLVELYQLPQDTNFSQGMTIDWSRDDQGYHAAVGYGIFPHYFSQLNTFETDGGGYFLGSDFGDELSDGLPPVECGDLAIPPGAPCPADLTGSSDPNSPNYGSPDGVIDGSDFFYYLDQFTANNLAQADLTGSSDPNDPSYGTPDGALDGSDFFYYLDIFTAGCP